MEIQELVDSVEGKLVGNNEYFSIDGFTGKFTFLNDAFHLIVVLYYIAVKNAAENETMLDLNLDQARIKIQ